MKTSSNKLTKEIYFEQIGVGYGLVNYLGIMKNDGSRLFLFCFAFLKRWYKR